MKENYSLFLTNKINEKMQLDLSAAFFELFPFQKLQNYDFGKSRDRIYNPTNTLLTMLLTMVEEDKSLQTSVNLFSLIHENNRKELDELDRQIKAEYKNPSQPRKPGRPRESIGRVAKSKTKEISFDTSGYSKARQRLPIEALKMVFEDSKNNINPEIGIWHGYRVFITDGTFVQLQDTEAIKEVFRASTNQGYPKGLFQGIIEQGIGTVYNFTLGSDSKSELELIYEMMDTIPSGSLLLADDLYNCFSIFALLEERDIKIIVPGKRVRNYEVIEEIGTGDEIVQIKKSTDSKWLNEKKLSKDKLQLRRIEYNSISEEGKKNVLYTSLLDKEISKEEIILKYESRWDIEVSIREVKTIMDINIVRSKSPDMVYKEIYSAIIAYNFVRQIIAKSTDNGAFSPEGDIIQKCYQNHRNVFVDKLGRTYSRWSPGRNGYNIKDDIKACNSKTSQSSLSKKVEKRKI